MRDTRAYYHIIMLYSFSADCSLVSVEYFENKVIQIRIKKISKHKVYNNQLCKWSRKLIWNIFNISENVSHLNYWIFSCFYVCFIIRNFTLFFQSKLFWIICKSSIYRSIMKRNWINKFNANDLYFIATIPSSFHPNANMIIS